MPATIITAERYHDFSCGHRVFGHESKCAHLHGHNYRVTFTLRADLDKVGRVLDFGIIKSLLCEWLEECWDHQFLLWEEDDLSTALADLDPDGVVLVPFNPTAENMAAYLLEVVAPAQLRNHPGVSITQVKVEETRKCSASARRVGGFE